MAELTLSGSRVPGYINDHTPAVGNNNNSITQTLFCWELTSTQILNPGTMMSSDKMNEAHAKKRRKPD